MSETANYGLYVTDDSSEMVINVRKKIFGEKDSNMTKIDSVLAQKADTSRFINTILKASAWSGSDIPAMQVLVIDELKALQNGIINLSQDITSEQFEEACAAKLYVSGQEEGSLTISAACQIPSCDIPVTLILIG